MIIFSEIGIVEKGSSENWLKGPKGWTQYNHNVALTWCFSFSNGNPTTYWQIQNFLNESDQVKITWVKMGRVKISLKFIRVKMGWMKMELKIIRVKMGLEVELARRVWWPDNGEGAKPGMEKKGGILLLLFCWYCCYCYCWYCYCYRWYCCYCCDGCQCIGNASVWMCCVSRMQPSTWLLYLREERGEGILLVKVTFELSDTSPIIEQLNN